jgi:type I restriction enzyme S subunit
MTRLALPLGEVCSQDRVSIRSGERPELRYLGMESIESQSGRLVDGALPKTPDAPEANSFAFTPEHVLYGKLRPYLNKVYVPSFPGKCSTELIPLRPTGRVLREYLAYFLRAPSTVEKIATRVAGARMPRADMSYVMSLPIPLPVSQEQRRIVDLLSRAENIVRMRQEAEQKANEIIPALFLDMFGDPATNPKWWKVAALGDLFVQKPNYGTMIPARTEPLPWLCLRVANIQGGRLVLSDKKYVSLPDDAVRRHEVLNGDILMARAIGSLDHLGKCVVAHTEGANWAFDSHLMRIRLLAEHADPVWLKALLSSDGGRRLFLEKTRRTAVQFNINTKEMAAIRVPLPPKSLQDAFATLAKQIQEVESQQACASVLAERAFQSLLAGVFQH